MMLLLRRLLVVLALVSLGAGVGALPAYADATVSGTVTIAGDTTTPVNGTVEFADAANPGSWGGVYITNGTFSRRDLAAGSYLVRFRIATMDGTVVYYDGTADGSPNLADAVPVVVGTAPVQLTVEVPQIGRLAGTVKNGSGGAMPGVTVLRNRLGLVSSTSTDAAGAYDFGYVRAGAFSVSVNPQPPWAGTQQSVTMPATGSITLDLVLPEAGTVAGTVTDADTLQPAAYVTVTAYRVSDTGYLGSDLTDQTGHYEIPAIGAEPFVLRFTDNLAGYADVWNGGAVLLSGAPPLGLAPGETLVHDEALTQRPDPRTPDDNLSGVVTAEGGGPLAGITVRASGAAGSFEVVSDRSGRWAMTGLPDGDYVVGFEQGYWLAQYTPDVVPWFPEYYPDAWAGAGAEPVTIAGGDHHPGIDAVLARAARLRITVTGPGASTDLNAGYRLVDAGTGATVVDHPPTPYAGNRLTVLLRPGSYRLLVSGRSGLASNATPLLSQWYGGGSTAAQAPVIAVAALDDVEDSTVRLPAGLRVTKKPTVRGKPTVGHTLDVTSGRWNLMTDTRFRYRWLRDGAVVGRAATYQVKGRDAGERLTVKVTARNGELSTTVATKVRVAGR